MQSSRGGRARRRALLAGAALSFGVFLWLAGIAAQQQWLSLDPTTRNVVRRLHDNRLDAPMQMLSVLGEGSGLIPLIALGTLVLWVWERRRWALGLPVIMTGTGGLQCIAKWAVDRPRPNLAAWGFPSGHVLSLAVFFGLLTYLLCTSRLGRNWRCFGGAVSAGTVLAVAFSRLYLDVHWLSDVVGGFVLGLAYLLFTIWLVEGFRQRSLATVVPLISQELAVEAVEPLTEGPAPISA